MKLTTGTARVTAACTAFLAATRMETDAGRASARGVRHEFIRKMEAASADSERRQSFFDSLLSIAKPVQGSRRLDQNNNNNQQAAYDDDAIQKYGIDMSSFALKYLGCQNIHTFSDDLAQDNDVDSVLGMDRFVTFRLCPRQTCSSYYDMGCDSGFGDYVISMEEYLEAMSQYYYAEYAQYCETCYQCSKLQDDYNDQAAANDDQVADGDDQVANGDDDANANANANRKLYQYNNYYKNKNQNKDDDYHGDDDDAAGDDDAKYNYDNYYDNNQNDQEQNGVEDYNCDYGNACDLWKTACRDYSPNAQDFEEFFQCAEFNMGNQVGYMGPHCRSDGHTIGIGIYSDQNCDQFIGDINNVVQYTGLDLDDQYMKAYYTDSCISCLAEDGFSLQQDGQQVVSDICGALYDESAKCNIHMGNNADGSYQSYQQEQQEKQICQFIDMLMTNSYNEDGEIVLEQETWRSFLPSMSTVYEMTQFQKWAMGFSVLLVVFLSFYSCHLHRSISQRKFVWGPRNSAADRMGMDQMAMNRMSRMQSGIMQNRSRSAGSTGLLT